VRAYVGRQVRFIFASAEIDLLEQHLREVGAAFVPKRSVTEGLDVQPGLAGRPGVDGSTPNIYRAVDLPLMKRQWIDTPWAEPPMDGYWGLDRDAVSYLDYLPCVPSNGHGRLWFATTRYVDRKTVPADPTFVAWANGILSWVRRTFTYDPGASLYRGPMRLATRRSRADDSGRRLGPHFAPRDRDPGDS
jgi:hypothetical protein